MVQAEQIQGHDGRAWIKVQYRPNELLDGQMKQIRGAQYSPVQKVWAVPWSSLASFEEKMGDHLIVWNNDDHPSHGGIDEDTISDRPIAPGYSVTYGPDRSVVSSTGFKTSPWGEFQVKGFNALLSRQFLILADDAGLGKTWQVGNAIEARKRMGQVKRGIVLVKASLLYNWRDELDMHTHEKSVVMSGDQKKRSKLYDQLARDNSWTFLIISYETFRDDVNVIQWLDNMQKLDFIILDEAHKIKNPTSKIGDNVHNIPFTYRYILTATPLPNSPLEAFNYLKLGKIIDMFWLQFRNEFAIMGGHANKEIIAYQNIKKLKEWIQSNMLRRLKRDKLKDLPSVTFRTIPIQMGLQQFKLYNAVVASILDDLKDTTLDKIPSALTKVLRLQQVTDSPALIGDDKTKSAKLDALDDLLTDLVDEGKNKVLVFSRFRGMIEYMTEKYQKYNPAVIHGEVDAQGKTLRASEMALKKLHPDWSSKTKVQQDILIKAHTTSERQRQVYKFQNDSSCKVFFGCAPACREGLTLTQATHVIFLDCEWSPAYVEQAFSRAHRIGQKNAVTVHFLVCQGTIDEHVQTVLKRKETMAQVMLDDGIEAVGRLRAKETIEILVGKNAA